MASARKKQDEKNLKILRELVSLPGNKHCFDCNQRGPTYVNVTIGSFVCTKCSGILRGLTPPHRVKSISMASFTAEEIDLVKNRGNDYCRQTWLALYDTNTHSETKNDDQQIKDFMVDKYERKRYYHDKGIHNGNTNGTIPKPPITKTNNSIAVVNGTDSTDKNNEFVADFNSANIFSASQFNNNATTINSQPSFANFDNNVIFNSDNTPPAVLLNGNTSTIPNNNLSPSTPVQFNQPQAPPSEDRYAALKDLDNAFKSKQEPFQQQHLDWGTIPNGNGSGYATPSPLFGSPASTGAVFDSSPQFFAQQDTPAISNPFTTNLWQSNGGVNAVNSGSYSNLMNGTSNRNSVNPFRNNVVFPGKFNGFDQSNSAFSSPIVNSSHFVNNNEVKTWNGANPFTLGVAPGSGSVSNNPFL